MSGPEDVAALVPHAGTMCLLERVLDWDQVGITLATTTHASPANPLRRHGRLDAIHLCEYGAQAMAVHGALAARSRGATRAPGMLVSLREVVWSARSVEALAGELIVRAERLQAGAAGLQYAFRVSHGGVELARGRAAVIEGAA